MGISHLTQINLRPAALAVVVAGLTPVSNAQEVPEPELRDGRDDWMEATVFAASEWVQNATGTINDDDEIDELQLRLGGTFDGQHHSELTNLRFDYQAERREYQEDSQESETLLNGSSSFFLGSRTSPLSLTAAHSIRRVLDTAQSPSIILTNSQEREIVSVTPRLQTHIGQANILQASVTQSRVRYQLSEINDTDRQTSRVSYTRLISPIHSLGLAYEYSDVEFLYVNPLNYTSDTLYLMLTGQHRRYAYQVNLGQTRLMDESDSETSELMYSLEFTTDVAAGSQFTLFAHRRLSDTSLGNANDEDFNDEVGFDGDSSVVDIIVRRSVGLDWQNQWLCDRCTLNLHLTHENVDYQTVTTESFERQTADVHFAYSLSRPFILGVSQGYVSTSFSNVADNSNDDKRLYSRLDLNYLFKDAQVTAAFTREIQDQQLDENIAINTYSLQFTWRFE